MAQNRLRDYNQDVGSFEHDIMNLGLHSPGRYMGFDTLEFANDGNDLHFYLKHTGTGQSYQDPINNVYGPLGMYLTPQGVIITEDAHIGVLAIATNVGNGQTRWDAVVANHSADAVVGGVAATYSIIQGPNNSSVKPILVNTYKQTLLGLLEIPAGATSVLQCIWHKSKCPDSGDGEDARLGSPNMFRTYNGFAKSKTIYTAKTDTLNTGGWVSNMWVFQSDGNSMVIKAPNPGAFIDGFYIKDVPLQEGMRVFLLADSNVTLRESPFLRAAPQYYNQGYRDLKINAGLGNTNIGNTGGGSILGVQANVGEQWEYEFVLYNDSWYLASIGGANSRLQGIIRGMMIEWYGDVNANTDTTGLGINLMAGFAVCNGGNGTPDRRGTVTTMDPAVPSYGQIDYSTDIAMQTEGVDPYLIDRLPRYTRWGYRKHFITQQELPNFGLDVQDPGHTHTYDGVNNPGRIGDVNKMSDPAPGKSTSKSYTGITVNLNGGGQAFDYQRPAWGTVYFMKL